MVVDAFSWVLKSVQKELCAGFSGEKSAARDPLCPLAARTIFSFFWLEKQRSRKVKSLKDLPEKPNTILIAAALRFSA